MRRVRCGVVVLRYAMDRLGMMADDGPAMDWKQLGVTESRMFFSYRQRTV
jgi:hypothetical protein